MTEATSSRRLAAILAADVVGYSRMMAADEAGTHAALRRHRAAVFNPTVPAYHGRIVKLIGDGTLVEFASVVDAVNCALAIKRSLATEVATGPKITLRSSASLEAAALPIWFRYAAGRYHEAIKTTAQNLRLYMGGERR